jgi:hypothetical protein
MEKRGFKSYLTPLLLGVFIFASNFLNTNLFQFGTNNFAVWFVLSFLCFASGWYIDKSLGWHSGGKAVFAVIVGVTIISISLITFFREYFSASDLLTENLILYSLRNITLGAIAIFGMAIVEVLTLQREVSNMKDKLIIYEDSSRNAKKEAEMEMREAKFKAQKIINDAEMTAKNIFLKKERIERELKEFIQAEKELIKKYQDAGQLK